MTPSTDGRDRVGSRVLYVQYTNPAAYPPLEHGAVLLAEAGCRVRFFGIRHADDPMVLEPHPGIEADFLSPVGPGWRQKWHYLRFLLGAVREARAFRPHWIYASDPLSTPVAVVLDLLGFGTVVYHEHDAPTGPATGEATRFMRLVQVARRRIATRAALCIVPNARRAEAFGQSTGREDALVVWNVPLGREVRPAPAPADPGRLRVVYHGSIVPARLPESVLEAVAQVEGASLTVIGYDPAGGAYLDRLRAKAIECRLGTRVQLLAARPRRDLLRVTETCDVGLALMPLSTFDTNEQTMDGASNKPFDYLACGLAVLVSDRREWRSLIVEPGFGLACDPSSVAGLVGALTWFLAHPEERRRMAGAGQDRVRAAWNYEQAFAPVIGRLTGDVGRGPIASLSRSGDARRAGGH